MPIVGNDIVDLKDRANAQKNMDLRFQRKILTDSEINRVAAADDPAAALWSLWASKEAAYKVIKKINSNASFIPRRWSVDLGVSQTGLPVGLTPVAENGVFSDCDAMQFLAGQVSIPGQDHISVRLFFFSDAVHCIASNHFEALPEAIWGIVPVHLSLNGREVDPSGRGRQALVQHLAGQLNLNPADIKIIREKKDGELLPPHVFFREKPLPADISLSHDGSFIAYAFHVRPAI